MGALKPSAIKLSYHVHSRSWKNETPCIMRQERSSGFRKYPIQQQFEKRNTNMLKRTALITLPVLALVLGGCASTSELKASIDQAQRTADEAKKSAEDAKSMAADAKSTADRAMDAASKAQADANDARSMASQAQQDAAAAKSAADTANEKADRMFKKAMSK